MKIVRMTLPAYGPFTDLIIDFAGGPKDFHLIYGSNEAGKSSALRALRRMLFGIPVRKSDSFLHPNPRLRIGARLVRSDGVEIEFIRRKGQSKTLRGPDDETLLDDDALVPFLGGVSQAVFEQMFAIGHEDLVTGGREIISGGGNVGQALFAAGAGLVRLQSVQEQLLQECETLFKPSGSKPVINSTVSSLKDVRKNQKSAQLPAKDWKSHHQALGAARQQLEKVRQKLTQSKQQSSRLERIRQALPLMARKKEIDTERVDYEGVPELPEDFGDKRREIENELKFAESDLKRANETIQSLNEQINLLAVPEKLLQHAAMVEALQHDLGSYRKAQNDRPGLKARMRTLDKQAAEKLAEIGKGTLADPGKELKLPPAVAGEIKDLGHTFERLTTRLDDARKRCRTLETQITALTDRKKSLKAPQDVTVLKAALQGAQDAGPIEKQITQKQAAIESREKALHNALKRLSLWSGTLEDLDALCCPSRESVDQFELQLGESLRKLEKLKEEKRSTRQDILQIQADLNAIELSRDVPTEADLAASRSDRGVGWRLIRGKLENIDPAADEIEAFTRGFDGKSSLPDAFEKSIELADRISDRLRREAEQVSRKSVLEAGKHQREENIKDLDQVIDDSQTQHAALSKQWEKLWMPAGIQPLSPKEMRTWLADIEAIREKLADLRSEKAMADAMVKEKESLMYRLAAALANAGLTEDQSDSLATRIGVAKAHVESSEALRSHIESLDRDLEKDSKEKDDVSAAIANLKNDLDDWRVRWGKNVAKIGMDAEASPTAALVVMDSIREAKTLMDEADVLRKRIEGIDGDAGLFRQQVKDLVDGLAPDLKEEPQDRAALLLNARLTEARDLMSRQENLKKQLTTAEAQHQSAEKQTADATTRIRSFCREARCENPEDLEAIEKRSKIRQQMTSERQGLENRLRDLGGGATVEAFISKAELISADSIAPELERLADEIRALEQERSELDQTVGTEKAELKRMDGSARAAEQAQEAERLLAKLESDVEKYARLKIASVILARTIEQYREKHQGPLIKRASELFTQMTIGSFSGVRAEYDDKGSPVLVGIRPGNGQQILVAGMSDGTADQLYLALRLASLEQYLENNEPLPFVVDDILLRFDDQRALATLNVLAGLSEKTQVIFFTHHRHLVELADKKIDSSLLLQHTL